MMDKSHEYQFDADKIAQLEAENARLREELTAVRGCHLVEMRRSHRTGALQMNDEMKTLVTDAAKLLGLDPVPDPFTHNRGDGLLCKSGHLFNPLDPERGDLMKVAMAAGLVINYSDGYVRWVGDTDYGQETFMLENYNSLALAILRAASDVLRSRGGV